MNKQMFIMVNRVLLATTTVLLIVGCQSIRLPTASNERAPKLASPSTGGPASSQSATPPSSIVPFAQTAVRIKAGAMSPFTDSSGNIWAEDHGFSGGDTIERPDLNIANTVEPGIYRSEHYAMDSFSWPLANGKYDVKLHFAETYEGIEGPGQRVFSFNVQGHEFKDFDVWAKAGGPFKAYVETVPVEITDGKLVITFTGNIENPQINGIEIIPRS